ncbi:MAG: hypothetical protein CL537_00050 [Alcanivoracaceae bacterium]|nr:hypothetical protein [Alcanivoracaceae bacterium]MCG8436973.1 2OG-Fe(II) oxygenase [Pseudomonadales bacterium]|tara:strand:+ start:9258 stop:10022 length:765 start_codon:yes stop_codon:yes gene_type:complete
MNQVDLKDLAERCVSRVMAVECEQDPYKHIVVDNFVPDDLAKRCMDAFPGLENPVWEHESDTDIEVKSRTTWKSEFDIPEHIVDVVRIMNSAPFLKALSEKFEIPKLVADSYFTGGGLNVTQRGGLLDVHVDGNYHDATGLNRRMNALLYLNPEWEEGWGGEFGLYNEDGSKLIKKIAPVYNRLVVFDSHDYSYHGLPDPLNFPAGQQRKSVILYYYTVAPRPEGQISVQKPHSALWVKRNHNDKRGNKERKFT